MNFANYGLAPDTVDAKWSAIRMIRGRMLSECDWTQLPDVSLSQEEKKAWAGYRQELRDGTEIYASPDDVAFPEMPQKLTT